MAVLSQDVNMSTLGTPVKIPLSGNVADTYYRGAMVFCDTGGGAQVLPATGDRFVGISAKNQTVVSAGDVVEVYCSGVFWVPVGTNISAADEGELLLQDISATQSDNFDDTVSFADITPAANDQVIGRILRVTSTQMLIEIGGAFSGTLVRADTGTGDLSFI
jgi:hypothetical protein